MPKTKSGLSKQALKVPARPAKDADAQSASSPTPFLCKACGKIAVSAHGLSIHTAKAHGKSPKARAPKTIEIRVANTSADDLRSRIFDRFKQGPIKVKTLSELTALLGALGLERRTSLSR